MARHGRPVNVGLHRLAEPDGIAREQKKAAEAGDLIELLLAIVAADLDAVFLGQQRHKVAAIAFAVALDAADLVEERRQDAGIGIAHTGEGQNLLVLDRAGDGGLALLHRPFVQARSGIVDVAIEETTMI